MLSLFGRPTRQFITGLLKCFWVGFSFLKYLNFSLDFECKMLVVVRKLKNSQVALTAAAPKICLFRNHLISCLSENYALFCSQPLFRSEFFVPNPNPAVLFTLKALFLNFRTLVVWLENAEKKQEQQSNPVVFSNISCKTICGREEDSRARARLFKAY